MKWQSYPRPQLRREAYQILNGTWELNHGPIEVPFAPQSGLSGFEGELTETLTYERKFTIPAEWTKERILLHFGAVDQICAVYLNGIPIGDHEGGYLPFFFDITKAVRRDEENSLTVVATDTLDHHYPYGKQKKDRGGMWYTPVSGIWQTVWIENVPKKYIKELKLTPQADRIAIEIPGAEHGFTAVISFEGREIARKDFTEGLGEFLLEDPRLWTPETPHLYDISIQMGEDRVESYFALRTVDIREVGGRKRICLNGKPVFLHGILDQGYFEDGIYLPEKEEAYAEDILRMKELGFNLLRKHIKVEPEQFYYDCDRLGILVLQDMVNNGGYSYLFDTVLPTIGFKKRNDLRGRYHGREEMTFFERHMKETIRHLYNHPCIIGYTIFNEGWGQFDSDRMYEIAKELDPTRFYDCTSGWFAQKKSDVDSEHIYFRVERLTTKERPLFLSECGGYTYKIEDHAFNPEKTYGYGACTTTEELTDRIVYLYENMVLGSIADGMCGCIYTQLSDVEDEVNGMYTYDRKVCKVQKEKMQSLAKRLYAEIEAIGD